MTQSATSKDVQARMHAIKDSLAFMESELFQEVQLASLFPDSKTFADAILLAPLSDILDAYALQKTQTAFDLRAFVNKYFDLPPPIKLEQTYSHDSMLEHINRLWQILQRESDTQHNDSLIALPEPYIVPGGRFREIYYWDSYFTALGLVHAKKYDIVVSMLKNFLCLQNTLGLIPNGNRSYYYSRSQPPVLALYIALLQEHADEFEFFPQSSFFHECLQGLKKEYLFWMQGESTLSEQGSAVKRVVMMPNATVLNRYWDDEASPRPESYREDIELAAPYNDKAPFYRNIRAACESGWDFSSRWFADGESLGSIQTTHIIPCDLNALLYFAECKLAELENAVGDAQSAIDFEGRAQARKAAMQRYCLDQTTQLFVDYDFVAQRFSQQLSLAMVVPLFVGLADEQEARSVAQKIKHDFLQPGGLLTTLKHTQQQWDAPNAWAPLHWFAVKGFERYGEIDLAENIKSHWLSNVGAFYQAHGCMMEKYKLDKHLSQAEGGEYEVQQGFGWTNAVTLLFANINRP